MRQVALTVAILAAALAMPGCATRNYGRQSSLTGNEKEAMTCQEIDREMNKVVEFSNYVKQEGEPREPGFLDALEGYWIGNSLEKGAALESANNRMIELWNLRDEKHCNPSVSAEVQVFPVQ